MTKKLLKKKSTALLSRDKRKKSTALLCRDKRKKSTALLNRDKTADNDQLSKEFHEVFWDDVKTPLLAPIK